MRLSDHQVPPAQRSQIAFRRPARPQKARGRALLLMLLAPVGTVACRGGDESTSTTTVITTSTTTPVEVTDTTAETNPSSSTPTSTAATDSTSTTTAPTSVPVVDNADLEQCTTFTEDWMSNGHIFPCDEGPSVRKLQQALSAWDLGLEVPTHGRYDIDTQRAVVVWQLQRDWPRPTLAILKEELLGVQIESILDDPTVSRTATCPRWFAVSNDELLQRMRTPGEARLVLQMCEMGEPVRNVQFMLNQSGYNLAEDGYYGPATYRAVLQWMSPLPGEPHGNLTRGEYESLMFD